MACEPEKLAHADKANRVPEPQRGASQARRQQGMLHQKKIGGEGELNPFKPTQTSLHDVIHQSKMRIFISS
jgi:hypothetical protein